ncbi:hypothetical protein HZB01_05600 [Candidatus Woesearchaeota archaeon]|nr:hypothetical protein [Candidatus Woesearchaeota archaeon]
MTPPPGPNPPDPADQTAREEYEQDVLRYNAEQDDKKREKETLEKEKDYLIKVGRVFASEGMERKSPETIYNILKNAVIPELKKLRSVELAKKIEKILKEKAFTEYGKTALKPIEKVIEELRDNIKVLKRVEIQINFIQNSDPDLFKRHKVFKEIDEKYISKELPQRYSTLIALRARIEGDNTHGFQDSLLGVLKNSVRLYAEKCKEIEQHKGENAKLSVIYEVQGILGSIVDQTNQQVSQIYRELRDVKESETGVALSKSDLVKKIKNYNEVLQKLLDALAIVRKGEKEASWKSFMDFYKNLASFTDFLEEKGYGTFSRPFRELKSQKIQFPELFDKALIHIIEHITAPSFMDRLFESEVVVIVGTLDQRIAAIETEAKTLVSDLNTFLEESIKEIVEVRTEILTEIKTRIEAIDKRLKELETELTEVEKAFSKVIDGFEDLGKDIKDIEKILKGMQNNAKVRRETIVSYRGHIDSPTFEWYNKVLVESLRERVEQLKENIEGEAAIQKKLMDKVRKLSIKKLELDFWSRVVNKKKWRKRFPIRTVRGMKSRWFGWGEQPPGPNP